MKSDRSSKLAINGGPKSLNRKLPHYSWPPITTAVKKRVMRQMDTAISIYDQSGIFDDFEKDFAKMHGKKFALLCSSGTLAIHSMFVAAGFKSGDEVICPAYTFFATVTPLLQTGATPILCDCDENGNIDPDEIEKKITSKTKGVVVTHMWGMPCQMERISEICKKNRILLLEDCSHAHGASLNGRIVGSFGDMAAWSLQGLKNVSGGEGGILVTDNEEFYYKCLLLGHYNKRCKQEIPKDHHLYKFATTGIGLKYRAHPLAVAIAYNTLSNIKKYQKTRDFFASKIREELSKMRGLVFPKFYSENTKPSWYGLVFQYEADKLGGLSIEKFYDALKAEGLLEMDRPHSTSPLNLLPLFNDPGYLFDHYKANGFSYKKGDFPKAEKFYMNAIKMPVWALNSDRALVDKYIKGLKKVIFNYKQLT